MHRIIVFVVMRCGPLVFVCGEPVMVLGMIVIGVLVDVQRRDLAGGRGQNQSEKERAEAMHNPQCMRPSSHGQTGADLRVDAHTMRPVARGLDVSRLGR